MEINILWRVQEILTLNSSKIFFFDVLQYGRSLVAKLSILGGPRPFSSSLHTVPSISIRQSWLNAFYPFPVHALALHLLLHNRVYQPVPFIEKQH